MYSMASPALSKNRKKQIHTFNIQIDSCFVQTFQCTMLLYVEVHSTPDFLIYFDKDAITKA